MSTLSSYRFETYRVCNFDAKNVCPHGGSLAGRTAVLQKLRAYRNVVSVKNCESKKMFLPIVLRIGCNFGEQANNNYLSSQFFPYSVSVLCQTRPQVAILQNIPSEM